MPLTAAQTTAFFEAPAQMGIPHPTVIQLQDEGISTVDDLVQGFLCQRWFLKYQKRMKLLEKYQRESDPIMTIAVMDAIDFGVDPEVDIGEVIMPVEE
jgi:hypothetical protein